MTAVEPFTQAGGGLTMIALWHMLNYRNETNDFRDSWAFTDYFQSENIEFISEGESFEHEWRSKEPYWLGVGKHMNVPHGIRYPQKDQHTAELMPVNNFGFFPESRADANDFDLAKREHILLGGGTEAGYLSMYHDVLTGSLKVDKMDDHPTFHSIRLMPIQSPCCPLTMKCILLVTYHFEIEVETVEHPLNWLPISYDLKKSTQKNIWDHQRLSTKAAHYPTFSTFGMPDMGTVPIERSVEDGISDGKTNKRAKKRSSEKCLPSRIETLEQLEFN